MPVDTNQFDALTRAVARPSSRRAALALLAAGALSPLVPSGSFDAASADGDDRGKKRRRRKRQREIRGQLPPPQAVPPTCDVCASGCSYSDLRAAINAASAGATIRLCAGEYKPGPAISINKQLTLAGVGVSATILKGSGQVRTMEIGPAGNVTLRDLTVTGGKELQKHRLGGAGIIVWDRGRLTMERCLVAGNHAAEGGGITVNKGSSLTLVETAIEHNTAATIGGGVLVRRGGTATIKSGTRIAENYARVWGAGIYAEESAVVTLESGSVVTENTGGEMGGGIVSSRATVNLADPSIVTGNQPDNCGGVVGSPIVNCVN